MSDTGDHGPPPPPPPVPPGGWSPPPGSATPPAAPPPPSAPVAPPPVGPAYPAAPPPAAYGPTPGYGYTAYPTAPRTDGQAIAALCCGIAAIPFTLACVVGIGLGVLGVVFGLVSMRRITRSEGALTGRGLALAGAICGGVGLSLSLAYLILVIVVSATDSSAPGALLVV